MLGPLDAATWLTFYLSFRHPPTDAPPHWIFSILFPSFVTMSMLFSTRNSILIPSPPGKHPFILQGPTHLISSLWGLSLPPPITPLFPRWSQQYLYLILIVCEHTSILVFIIWQPGCPRVSLPSTTMSLKAQNMSYSFFTFPGSKIASLSFSIQYLFAEFYCNSKFWKHRGIQHMETKSIHSPMWFLLCRIFTSQGLFYRVWKINKSTFSIKLHDETLFLM